MWNLISPREKSLSILKIITIRANAVASAFATGQTPNELCYRRVGADAESLQLLLRNRGAMAATQTLKSDTLHTRLLAAGIGMYMVGAVGVCAALWEIFSALMG